MVARWTNNYTLQFYNSRRRRSLKAYLSGTIRFRITLAVFMVACVGGLSPSCNQHPLYQNPPNFRGVTVPLPPPSFAANPVLSLEIDVTIPWGHVGSDTVVYLYESRQDQGYFIYGRQAIVRFSGVEIDSRDNCLMTYFETEDGEESAVGFSQVVLNEDIEQCKVDTSCSELDTDMNACLCVVYRSTGC